MAICSTYAKLKEVLEPLSPADEPHLGLVQYGNKHIPPGQRNLIANIGTKSEKCAQEQEVRAMLWILNTHETGNRHIDPDNRYLDRPIYPTTNDSGIWRDIDVQCLITEVIVSPFADPSTLTEVEKERSAIPATATWLSEGMGVEQCSFSPLPTHVSGRNRLGADSEAECVGRA